MSYILDALRRLEQDKEKSKRGANPMEAVLLPDVGGAERPARKRLWLAATGIFLLLAVIAVTSWVTRHVVVSTEPAAEGTIPPVASAPPGRAASEPPFLSEVESSSFEPLRPGTGRKVSASTPPAFRIPEKRPSPPSSEGPQDTPEPSSPVRAEEVDLRAVSEEEEGLPDPEPEPDDANESDFEEEVLEEGFIEDWQGSDIKINAIAYSRDAENRFAVVNLKTVHEGDQVDGLSVVSIQENGIVFEWEGTRYRVLLGRR